MTLLRDFLQNRVLFAAVIAWMCAQVLKIVLTLITTKKVLCGTAFGGAGAAWGERAFRDGVRLTIAMARFEGVNSATFALAVMFAFVTMYDAMGGAPETGEHAKLLNKYMNRLEREDADVDGDGVPDREVEEIELKEFIGHTPLEVLGGVLLGILVGILIPA